MSGGYCDSTKVVSEAEIILGAEVNFGGSVTKVVFGGKNKSRSQSNSPGLQHSLGGQVLS